MLFNCFNFLLFQFQALQKSESLVSLKVPTIRKLVPTIGQFARTTKLVVLWQSEDMDAVIPIIVNAAVMVSIAVQTIEWSSLKFIEFLWYQVMWNQLLANWIELMLTYLIVRVRLVHNVQGHHSNANLRIPVAKIHKVVGLVVHTLVLTVALMDCTVVQTDINVD